MLAALLRWASVGVVTQLCVRGNFRLQGLLDVAGDRFRRRLRCIPRDHLAVAANQELGKVPLDFVAKELTLLTLQIRIERVRVRAVHIDLLEDRKGAPVLGCESKDILGRARLLPSKLVAWKCEDREFLGLVALLELLQFAIVRVR